MIPRAPLFGNPDKLLPTLSPDASKLAYVAPRDGVLNVWVGPASDPGAAKPITHDKVRGIRTYGWAHSGRHILYLQDLAGEEDWHVYSVDLDSGRTLDLTPIKGVSARIHGMSREFPDEILIGLNDRDKTLHDVHRVNIDTGERQLVVENPGFMQIESDSHFRVRLGHQMEADGGIRVKKPDGAGGWQDFFHIPAEDALATSTWGIDRAGRKIYLADSRGRDTSALVRMDLESGEREVLFASDRADVSGALRHPIEHEIEAVAYTWDRRHWQVLNPSIAPDLEYLAGVVAGELAVITRSDDDAHWMVAYTMDDGPVRYYHYDREARNAKFLFTHRSDLEGQSLGEMHPVVIPSRDGLDLMSYLTLPAACPRRTGVESRPDAPLPMVLWVHGGPWGRDNWGFNAWHQLFADRGYAVLSVNFRASTGFGKSFTNAGDLEWGAAMHDDLIDAVEWAVAEGVAERSRIAIAGGSYGGYATLAGLAFTPEVFACGVDIVGPSNLVTLLESVPPYWGPQIQLFRTRVGDNTTDEGRELLRSRSPLTHADRICRPLLIAQGANDPRVKQAESDQIVSAMQEKGIPVTYLLFPDEGHGFARPENQLSFVAVAEAFLARHLGGGCEPIGNAFEGSTIQALSGAEQIPELEAALRQAREPS